MNKTFTSKITGVFFLFLFTVAASLFSIGTGSVEIPFMDIPAIFFTNTSSSAVHETSRIIVLDVRLPRVVTALIAGGVLAVAGAAFQALLRNPLADPFILGVSGGAALGGVLAITSGWAFGGFYIQVFAFAGALASIFFVYFISSTGGRIPKYKMLLAGVVVNAFLSALIMLLLSLSQGNSLLSATFWLMGDLSGASWNKITSIVPFALTGLCILYLMSREMNLLLLGEEQAQELGVNIDRAKACLFIAASLATGAVVSTCGPIGFVGLIVPHGVRLVWGADHRILIPASLLLGGAFLTLADTVARTVLSPRELPVGVITALVGGPVFVYLMKKKLHE